MITLQQRQALQEQAYVPEHLPGYVTAITADLFQPPAQPYLVTVQQDQYLFYLRGGQMTFVGYPLCADRDQPLVFDLERASQALEQAMASFRPRIVSYTGPEIPPAMAVGKAGTADAYYRLDLARPDIPQKVRNMVLRARREIKVEAGGAFSREHDLLIRAFLRTHHDGPEMAYIFKRISRYVKKGGAVLYSARNGRGELVAFDVADFNAKNYAFYMFNLRYAECYVPGASDLLLNEIILQARQQGKRYLNLGLGINPGVTFFKLKWGAQQFLPHVSCLYQPGGGEVLEGLYEKL